jgi:hypothetical protein
MAEGQAMKHFSKTIYRTPAELEARIRQRMDEAMLLPPNTDEHRAIMQEIAKLRIYADAKRWLNGPAKQQAWGTFCYFGRSGRGMPQYYFDIRGGEYLYSDEEGLDLRAAKSKPHVPWRTWPTEADRHQMAIEVRTPDGPLSRAAFIFEISRNNITH